MKLRAQLLRAWSGPLPTAAILPAHYPLEVASERTVCEACGFPLRRQRTSARYPRGVVLGRPRVRYVEKQCVRCGRLYRCEEYHRLVPPQGNYAFDLIVVVGLARFREHRQPRRNPAGTDRSLRMAAAPDHDRRVGSDLPRLPGSHSFRSGFSIAEATGRGSRPPSRKSWRTSPT